MKRTLALLLAAVTLMTCGPAALADESVGEPAEAVIDTSELDALIGGYIEDKGLDPQYVSVGYCYTATGEEYYCNGDAWFYSASLYKVPLMMIFAESVYDGELTQDSIVAGLTLSALEEQVLVYSANELAYAAMDVYGTNRECRELYKAFAPGLEDEYYDDRFLGLSFFTARFMTKVMKTLQSDPERFPNVTDCLLRAQPDNYYRLTEGELEIAQKYGSYLECQHAAAIINASTPIVVTVMTRYTYNFMSVISDIGMLLVDYTAELDARLEAERLAEEEAARMEAERQAIEQALEEQRRAEEQALEEQAAAEEAARLALEAEEAERLAAQEAAQLEREAELRQRSIYLLAAALALAIIVCGTMTLVRRRKRRVHRR